MEYPKKACKTCARCYVPTSRHADCPRCRNGYKFLWDTCMCGYPKKVKSVVCLKCRGKQQRAEFNGHWKGGKAWHTNGYAMLRTPGHPRGQGASSYVFEHILVMEKKLGRYLFENENVHHKNGIKVDNRKSNLELWTRPQPVGVRVKDALKWAYKIIERYG